VSVAGTSDAVWAANYRDDTVSRIDPPTDRVVAQIQEGVCPMGVSASADRVWVTNYLSDTVSVIDPGIN
jgi:YVTN family beta-propeller protein